jgi:hypothetical protein
VTETTRSNRSANSRSSLTTGRIWLGVVLVLLGAIGCYALGRGIARLELTAARDLNQQLQSESERLKATIADQTANLTSLQADLKKTRAALNAIMPAANSYTVNPNQSIVVADGRLTIGLVGSPANGSINLNINGKQQAATAGDIIHVALDGSTGCDVALQSFDMFRALLTASCAATKPQ